VANCRTVATITQKATEAVPQRVAVLPATRIKKSGGQTASNLGGFQRNFQSTCPLSAAKINLIIAIAPEKRV